MKTHQNGSKCVWTASVVLGMPIGKKSTLPALFFSVTVTEAPEQLKANNSLPAKM